MEASEQEASHPVHTAVKEETGYHAIDAVRHRLLVHA